MTKACYVGVDGIAKKVTKVYTGVDNIARKVKKGYIGVGGVARPFFSAEKKLEFYGNIYYMYAARTENAATTIGDYAIFAGGYSISGLSEKVHTYTTSLVLTVIDNLSRKSYGHTATTVGDYALFGGGTDNKQDYATVDTYTSTLVKGTAADLSSYAYYLAATTLGNYALFGGGYRYISSSNIIQYNTVDVYTSSLVKSSISPLSYARCSLAATTVGDYALFGGGTNYSTTTSTSTYFKTVDTYSSSLVKSTANDLTVARSRIAATTIGNYALFGGGFISTAKTDAASCDVDVYTSSLVKGLAENLSMSGGAATATTVGDYALFGGGRTTSNTGYASYFKTVDTYSSSLVKSTANDSRYAHSGGVATTIGDYAIFSGNAAYSDIYVII